MVTMANPPTTLITSAEFADRYGEDDRVELWRGVVVATSPNKPMHSKVAVRSATALGSCALETGTGEFWPPDAGLTIEEGPDTVVSPDLSFIPADVARRLNDDEPGFPFFVPPLVVEITSPNDSERGIAAKLTPYYAAGVTEIWWVRARQRTLTRCWGDRDPVVLRSGETLGDIAALPGFSMAVDDMFPLEELAGGEG